MLPWWAIGGPVPDGVDLIPVATSKIVLDEATSTFRTRKKLSGSEGRITRRERMGNMFDFIYACLNPT